MSAQTWVYECFDGGARIVRSDGDDGFTDTAYVPNDARESVAMELLGYTGTNRGQHMPLRRAVQYERVVTEAWTLVEDGGSTDALLAELEALDAPAPTTGASGEDDR